MEVVPLVLSRRVVAGLCRRTACSLGCKGRCEAYLGDLTNQPSMQSNHSYM